MAVPEDDRLDKYLLDPILKAACRHVGRPRARVRVVDHPRPRGIATVLSPDFLNRVMLRYPMADAIVYCVDRDGRPGRVDEFDHLFEQVSGHSFTGRLGTVLAHQELEVWALSLHRKDLDASWDDVRAEVHPKERFFEPLVQQLELQRTPGQGRMVLGEQAAKRYDLLRDRCPELQDLEKIISAT